MSLSLEAKVRFSMRRIEEYLDEYGAEGTYVSFSGGMDSTVLLHLVRRVDPSVKGVFIDTWMEDPRIREYVCSFPNIDIIKPQMLLKDIIAECGWCWPSKDIAQAIYYAREGKQWAINKLSGLDREGNYSEYRQRYKKFLPVLDWDVLITPGCCNKQKEEPIMKYEEQNKVHPFLGLRAEESARRRSAYLRTGCNSFDMRMVYNEETGGYDEVKVARPVSKPISIWTSQDILQYCVNNHIVPAKPYGTIYSIGNAPGQLTFFDDISCKKLGCTGDKRTGCIFCPVGCHLDNFAKFKNIKSYNHKLYDYCMEELGERKLLEKIQKQFGGTL